MMVPLYSIIADKKLFSYEKDSLFKGTSLLLGFHIFFIIIIRRVFLGMKNVKQVTACFSI